jgi:DNA mismatch repair protein MutS2
MRAEAALTLLDRYMDDALLANLSSAEIIHGKGSGVLRKTIRAHLAARFPTFTFADGEEPGRGTGVTLVRLK